MLLAYLRLDPAKIWKWNKPSKMSDSWKCRPRSSLEKGWAWKIKYLSFKVYTTHFLSLFLSVYPVTVALDRQKCLVSWPHTLIPLTLGGYIKLKQQLDPARHGAHPEMGRARPKLILEAVQPPAGSFQLAQLRVALCPRGQLPPRTGGDIWSREVSSHSPSGEGRPLLFRNFGFPEDQLEILQDELNLNPQDLEQQPSFISSLNSQRHVAFHLLNPL